MKDLSMPVLRVMDLRKTFLLSLSNLIINLKAVGLPPILNVLFLVIQTNMDN